MDYGFLKDKNGNKIYINNNSIYHEGKNLKDVIDEKETTINNTINQTKTELQNNINEISNVQDLQFTLVPNEEYIYNTDFIVSGFRIGKLVYIVVEFSWKKVFEPSDSRTVFISGFPTNLITSHFVYPTDAVSGHRYRMYLSKGNLLNWWGNSYDINYGDSSNKAQRLEILGYLQD